MKKKQNIFAGFIIFAVFIGLGSITAMYAVPMRKLLDFRYIDTCIEVIQVNLVRPLSFELIDSYALEPEEISWVEYKHLHGVSERFRDEQEENFRISTPHKVSVVVEFSAANRVGGFVRNVGKCVYQERYENKDTLLAEAQLIRAEFRGRSLGNDVMEWVGAVRPESLDVLLTFKVRAIDRFRYLLDLLKE